MLFENATEPPAPILIASVSLALPIVDSFVTTTEPPVRTPDVVMVEEPVSIVPKPDVIEPASRAPTPVTFVCDAV